ncbi:MAG: BamA/TamA family outer membrane protein [Acidobacteria bacterium]|nr:BamA/TamA family outer membrane protein [Acidobacteriota bacterium]
MPRRSLTLVLATAMALTAGSAGAQDDTRAELLARQRAEKAAQLQPYKPGKIERALLYFEESKPLQKITPYNGFFIQYGYTGQPVGSGVAFGGGWRHDLRNGDARVVLEAGQSFRGYRMVRADLSMPRLLRERLEVGLETSYSLNTQEDFYGLGSGSQRDHRVNFRFRAPEVQGRVTLTPVSWLNTGVRLGWMGVRVDGGTDRRFPSIEARFTDPDAPGLGVQPDFSYTDVFTTLDTRDQPGNARKGSYVGVLWRQHTDRDFDRYNFHQVDVDAQQFLPIFDKKRVIALRVQLLTTTATDGQEVPFYFRPTLGGSTSLRNVADFRFRDRNVLATTIEYRWEAFSGLDMALFSDFGSVAGRVSDLDLGQIDAAYGIGLRFNTYKAVFLRLDVAAGSDDGIRTFLKFSKVF